MRWIFRICMALVAMVVVALALLFMLPADRIGQIASEQLEKQTGRKLVLTGEFTPTLFPTLGVKTGGLSISNASWSDVPQMITADGAAVGVDLAALISGDVQIKTLRLTNPVIHLERAADGRANWDLSTAGPTTGDATAGNPSPSESGSTNVSLENGLIENGTVIFTDHGTGQRVAITEINGTAALPANTPSLSADISARVDGDKAAIKLSLPDRFAAMAGNPGEMELQVAGLGADLSFKGAVGADGSASGLVDLSAADLNSIAARLGVALPAQVTGLKNLRLQGPLTLSETALAFGGTIGGTLDGNSFGGNVTLSGDPGWMQTQSITVDTQLLLKDIGRVSFNGGLNPRSGITVEGALDAQIDDLRRALTLAKVSADLPSGTLKNADVAGAMTIAASGAVEIKGGRYGFDGNTLTGPIMFTPGNVPTIAAQLRAGALDLSGFTGDSSSATPSEGGAAGRTTTGWSKDPISVEGMNAVNADVTLRADSVDLGVTQLGTTDVKLRLRDGRLAVKLNRVDAFDGTLSGTANVRGGKAVSFSSDLTANGIELEKLLGQMAGITRLTGAGTTRLQLNGSGVSMDAIMRSLSGSGSVELGRGTIKGVDLAAMMRNLKKAFGGFEGATEFSSLTGTFQMDKGVLQNLDLSLISPLFRAGGKGSVDIGGQAMNYLVTPTSLAEGAEFTVPVTITGLWSNLKFKPDLEKLTELLLSGKLKDTLGGQEKLAEVRALLDDPGSSVEDSVKARIAEKLQKEFGGSDTAQSGDGLSLNPKPETGGSLEDQLKLSLADKLRKELGLGSDPQPAPTPTPAPPTALGTGTALALSTSGKRPRARPARLNTGVAFNPQPVDTATPDPAPEVQPDTRSTEEKVKDKVEDAVKDELKKLFKFD
ncbi:MAG: AsmA family protein [Pseudomonadota bacterium]